MKRNSFKNFLSTVENRVIVERDDFDGRDFSTIDRNERFALLKKGARKFSRVIRGDGDSFFYGLSRVDICRHGKNIHLKKSWYGKCWYSNGRFHLENGCWDLLTNLFADLGVGWWRKDYEWDELYRKAGRALCTPSVVRAILTGTIYSDETLWRFVARRLYRVNCGWRLFRDLYECVEKDGFVKIGDIRDFTDSFERSAKAVVEADRERLMLIKDVLELAVAVDEKVNLAWSNSRLRQHHQEQIRIVNGLSLGEHSADPVYADNEIVESAGVRMLRSEQDVYTEGLSMSHCLWTNYWNCIKDKLMLAFHLQYNGEESTLSVVRGRDGKPCLDQIHLSHNRSVSADTRQYALAFIGAHSDNIDRVLKQSADTVDDLPF